MGTARFVAADTVPAEESKLAGLLATSIGRKLGMAVTGIALLGFLGAHMLGNLRVLLGPDSINAYAASLQSSPLLWGMRTGLLLVFVLHVYLALSLNARNRAARPQRYVGGAVIRDSSFASRHLLLTGLLVLAFIVYHLLHFTFGAFGAELGLDAQRRPDVYSMVVHGFQNRWVSGSYLVAMGILGLHLAHGARSLFSTFGLSHVSYDALIRAAALGLVGLIIVGNCSIPVLVQMGVIAPR